LRRLLGVHNREKQQEMTPLYIVIAIAACLLIYRMVPAPEKIKKVLNQNRKFGASDEYYHVWVGG